MRAFIISTPKRINAIRQHLGLKPYPLHLKIRSEQVLDGKLDGKPVSQEQWDEAVRATEPPACTKCGASEESDRVRDGLCKHCR